MDGPAFFTRLKTLLTATPPSPPDAVTTGQNTIATWTQPPTTNGWNLTTTDIGTYGTDYGQRAYIALTALGANLPNDALYPSTAASADAGPHTLAFPADQLPPVNAFWSLTAYDEHGFLIPNTPRRLLHRPPLSRTHCGTDVVRSRPPGTGRCFLAVRSPGPGGKDNPP